MTDHRSGWTRGGSASVRLGVLALAGLLASSASAGIANDECTGAIPIGLGDTPFSTVGATTSAAPLPVDCDKGFGLAFVNDIWFSFVAPKDGVLTVYTCNQASYDSRLAGYGGTCANLQFEGCNDDGPGCGLTSLMDIFTFGGQTYYIRVGGFSGSGTGTLTLTYDGFEQSCPPSDHDCYSTGGPGCTDEECCLIVCELDPFCCQVAWDGICVGEAFDFCGAPPCDWSCPLGALIEPEPCGFDTNGGCNSNPPIFTAIACGDTFCGTNWASGGFRDTDWYQLVLPSLQEITFSVETTLPIVIGLVNTGGVPDCAIATALTPFAVAPFCGEASFSRCLEPGTYWLFVGANGFDGFPCGSANDYTVTLVCSGQPCQLPGPPNNNCADASQAFDGPNPFTTIDATTDGPPLPPECNEGFGLAFVNDVWFEYVATQTSVVTISTCNTATFDTRLALYEGTCGALDLIACNDDAAGCGLTSLLQAPVFEGQTYIIRIGGFAGSGTGTLNIFYGAPPGLPNDDCDDAIEILDGTTPFVTSGATTDGPPLPAGCNEGFGLTFVNDIWYFYTATCTGTLTVSTCGAATYDTRLAAYTGACGALDLVACNDDGPGCPGFTSIMNVPVVCGTTYLIRVGGFGGSGSGTLTLTCAGKPCAPDCPSDLTGDGVVDGADLGILLGFWGACPGCAADFNGDGVVDGADLGVLLGSWGDC
ncbi:MAG TPA: hypothetical protein PKC43_11770 [Phycisphaerales bacterium]|nr:hypothetical protein [Phycisphaerales bacterium]HMP38109.1 hypothetical protein [Phycisphaerales bacterium]